MMWLRETLCAFLRRFWCAFGTFFVHFSCAQGEYSAKFDFNVSFIVPERVEIIGSVVRFYFAGGYSACLGPARLHRMVTQKADSLRE